MKVAFLHSDKPRERILADAFLMGAAKHGHETASISLADAPEPGVYDVVAMVGVKSRALFHAHHRAAARIVYLDKGYSRQKSLNPSRGWEFWRVSLDAHHPTDMLSIDFPADRWESLGLDLKPWRRRGKHVLIAGSSAKYHEFYGLKEPTSWTGRIVRNLRGFTERPIVYRPKPSWSDAVPIEGTTFSKLPDTIYDALRDAHAIVTHGSNTCFEALVTGIPAVVLGPGVTRDISSTDLAEIENPRLASEGERLRLLRNLAYWQWSASEFASGQAWDMIGKQLHAV